MNTMITDLSVSEMVEINGGYTIPWGLIGKGAVRVAVGAAGVATGAGAAITAGILIYEACDALGVF